MYTFDTGMLIALERRDRRARAILDTARIRGADITVPAVVVAEWWRGFGGPLGRLLQGFDVEPLTEELAKIAGVALGKIGSSTLADAIVMASAAQRGDIVVTSDFDDLDRLRTHFLGVRHLMRV